MTLTPAQKESGWYLDQIEVHLRDHKRLVRSVTTQKISCSLRLENKDIRKQVDEKLLSLRMPKDVAALNALADRLDDPTPIPIKINI